MILYGVLGFRFNSKMRIKADAIAASMMGKGVFLSALEKIGRAFPSIMTRGRPSLAYPPGRPIVEKRIGAFRQRHHSSKDKIVWGTRACFGSVRVQTKAHSMACNIEMG